METSTKCLKKTDARRVLYKSSGDNDQASEGFPTNTVGGLAKTELRTFVILNWEDPT